MRRNDMPAATHTLRPATLAAHQQRVLKSIVQIESRLDAELSLDALARQAHLSPFHFQRVFTALVGESPAGFVRRLRLERAARRLRDHDEPVHVVASRAGYAETAPFTRAFRSLFDQSPVDLRASARRARKEPRQPAALRAWVNRPGPAGELRYEPVPVHPAREGPGPERVVIFWPVRIAWLRQRGEASVASSACQRLAQFAGRSRVSSAPMFVRILHDDDPLTPPELRRVDVGVVIGPRRRGEADIGVRMVGGGDHALVTVAGPERSIAAARAWLVRVGIARLGVTRREGPLIEIPLHDPTLSNVPASAMLTDILVPVAVEHSPQRWYWRRSWPDNTRTRPGRRTGEET
jgi:AraC family transcriptional regulator